MSRRSPLSAHAATGAELSARLAAERDGHPYLVYFDGADQQVLVSLRGRDRLTVGRRPANDLVLEWDESVSRLHVEFERVGGDWLAVDDGLSANGTWIGDVRVAGRRRLRSGDVVRAGSTLIAFCAPADTTQQTDRPQQVMVRAAVTPAQRRVLLALCRPCLQGDSYAPPPTNQQLAAELFLSIDAVKTHLKALFDAFCLDDLGRGQKRVALVERALEMAVVSRRDLDQ